MKKLAVIAFGGNALLKGDQKGTIDEQEENVFNTCSNLLELLKKDYDIVIGHGNGPQVGNVLLQHEGGFKLFGLPAMPIDFCVAETQGSIGYMIEQQMRNVLEREKMERDIITIITQVEVDKNDPAFQNPTKPVGPYYTKEEADKYALETGAKFAEDPRGRIWIGKGWKGIAHGVGTVQQRRGPEVRRGQVPDWTQRAESHRGNHRRSRDARRRKHAFPVPFRQDRGGQFPGVGRQS